MLHMADEHWDNPKCRWDVLKAHHEEAVARRALIAKYGDLYCAMQGQWDKRADKSSLRPEHQHGDYLDRLVKTGAEWYSPYRHNIGLIGLGNHETAIYKYHETCLIDRLCQSLRDKGGITCKGGYGGWIRVMLSRTTQQFSHRIYYHHGSGGGGPVTKGLIDFNRISEYIDADSIICGHVHWKNHTPREWVRLNESSCLVREQRHFIRCGTYKDEYDDGHAGFHIEKGRGPRPLGGWWQRFYVKNCRLMIEWTEAKA